MNKPKYVIKTSKNELTFSNDYVVVHSLDEENEGDPLSELYEEDPICRTDSIYWARTIADAMNFYSSKGLSKNINE